MYPKTILMLILGILVNVYLFFTADLPNRLDNGFTRNLYPQQPLLKSATLLSGNPQQILWSDAREVIIATGGSDGLLKLAIDDSRIHKGSPSFHYHDQASSALLVTNGLRKTIDTISLESHTVANAVALSPNSFILRKYEPHADGLKFMKFADGHKVLVEDGLSLPSADRGLSTDGHLLLDTISGFLTFTHYYNNQVLVFDTLLNRVNRFSTLDTVSPKHTLSLDRPRLVTNKTTALSDGRLYVCSNLRADNEPYKQYMKNIPIDVFEIPGGAYLGSFHLPAHKGKLIKSLYVAENHVLALYYDAHFSAHILPSFNRKKATHPRHDIRSRNTSRSSGVHVPAPPYPDRY